MAAKMTIAHSHQSAELVDTLKELLPMVKRVCEYGRDSFDLYDKAKTMNPLYLDCIRSLPKIEQLINELNDR